MHKTNIWNPPCGCHIHYQYDKDTGSFDTAIPIEGEFEHRLHLPDGTVLKGKKEAKTVKCPSHAAVPDVITLFSTLKAEAIANAAITSSTN